MELSEILKHAHSGWRWLVVLLLLAAFIKSLIGWLGNKPYKKADAKLATFAMVFTHIQLTMGLLLYFYSPSVLWANISDDITFIWTVKHPVMMIIAVVLITIGRRKAKKEAATPLQHRVQVIFFSLAILLIALGIPAANWAMG